jgi:hypothetical protein
MAKTWDKQSINAVNILLRNKALYQEKLSSDSRFLLNGTLPLNTLDPTDDRDCNVLWACHFTEDLYILAINCTQEGRLLHIICSAKGNEDDKTTPLKPLLIAEEWLHINLEE